MKDKFKKGLLVSEIIYTEGWQAVKEFADKRINQCRNELENVPKEDLEKVQSKIQTLRGFIKDIENWAKDSEERSKIKDNS